MKRKEPAARRHAENVRAAARRQARRERASARAASGTGPQPQNISPMKSTLSREEAQKREAAKKARESAR